MRECNNVKVYSLWFLLGLLGLVYVTCLMYMMRVRCLRDVLLCCVCCNLMVPL